MNDDTKIKKCLEGLFLTLSYLETAVGLKEDDLGRFLKNQKFHGEVLRGKSNIFAGIGVIQRRELGFARSINYVAGLKPSNDNHGRGKVRVVSKSQLIGYLDEVIANGVQA